MTEWVKYRGLLHSALLVVIDDFLRYYIRRVRTVESKKGRYKIRWLQQEKIGSKSRKVEKTMSTSIDPAKHLRAGDAVVEAWRARQPGGMSWALGHAVVGLNRRAHYFYGSSVMYGSTQRDSFSHIEGYEDHGVEMLFFWGADRKLTGIVINLACPSQETEGLSVISADFWQETRKETRNCFANNLHILAQRSAAGDISPHRMFRKRAEDTMRERRGLSWRQEIARRIVNAARS